MSNGACAVLLTLLSMELHYEEAFMPDGDEETQSLNVQFAEAFAAADGEEETGKTGSEDLSDKKGNEEAKTGEGEGKPGEGDTGDGEGEKPDPFKDVKLDDLLNHPVIGPILTSHADKVANARIASEVEKAKTTAKAEGRTEVTQEQEDRYFGSLSKEELARELAGDEELAGRYASWKARQAKADEPDEEAVAVQAQVYALSTAIRSNRELVEGSELPADVKASLAGENFTKHGANAMVEWNKAITQALAKHEAGKLASEDNEEAREAARNEARLEADRLKPGGVGVVGRGASKKLDLMKTPTAKLFADAFAE
jgi:hypothetical protein